ncbi:MAG: hypothetical protein ACO27N_02195, partial [Bacteroidia bacterium]
MFFDYLAMPSGWVLYLNIFWAMPFVRVYVFELFFGRCLSGSGYSGLALLGYCCAMNQALRIPIAV